MAQITRDEDILTTITEVTLPTPGWDRHSVNPQAALELDLRSLMRDLAAARLEIEEAGKLSVRRQSQTTPTRIRSVGIRKKKRDRRLRIVRVGDGETGIH